MAAEEIRVAIDIDSRNPAFVTVSEFKGELRLDVRKFYIDDEGNYQPTKKGISVRLDESLPLLEAILEAYNQATSSEFTIS